MSCFHGFRFAIPLKRNEIQIATYVQHTLVVSNCRIFEKNPVKQSTAAEKNFGIRLRKKQAVKTISQSIVLLRWLCMKLTRYSKYSIGRDLTRFLKKRNYIKYHSQTIMDRISQANITQYNTIYPFLLPEENAMRKIFRSVCQNLKNLIS